MRDVYHGALDAPQVWLRIATFLRHKPPAAGLVIHSQGRILFADYRARSILEIGGEEGVDVFTRFPGSVPGAASEIRKRTIQRCEQKYVLPLKGRVSGSWKFVEATPWHFVIANTTYRAVWLLELMQVEVERRGLRKSLKQAMME